jgi:predicted O-methyltransferase YrrM
MLTRRPGKLLRTSLALARNLLRARVDPRYWRRSIRIAREAILNRDADQKTAELAPLLGILSRQRPMRVVEIGTGRGGTLWAWCRVAAPEAHLVSIDLPGGPFGSGGYEPSTIQAYGHAGQTITLIQGDSHAPESLAAVKRAIGGPIDFLYIDGDHDYAGVSSDYAMYSPLVREGGLIAFHDIAPGPEEYVGGVPRFWRELTRPRKREIIDDLGSGGSPIKGFGIGIVEPTGVQR